MSSAPGDSHQRTPVLQFGEAADGRMVHIDDAQRGLACGLWCPECNQRLVARKGDIKQHHFAHESEFSCEGAVETALHKLAKQVISDAKGLQLPPVSIATDGGRKILSPSRWIEFDRVEMEVWMDGMRPDIIGYRQGRPLAIEVLVTHACGPEKIALFESRGVACVEIDVSGLRHGTRDLPEAILRSSPRLWLFNRFISQEMARLKAEREKAAVELKEFLEREKARQRAEEEAQLALDARRRSEAEKEAIRLRQSRMRDVAVKATAGQSFDWAAYQRQEIDRFGYVDDVIIRGGNKFQDLLSEMEDLAYWVANGRLLDWSREHPKPDELLGLPLEKLLAERLKEHEEQQAKLKAEREQYEARQAAERAEAERLEKEAVEKFRDEITQSAISLLGPQAAEKWLRSVPPWGGKSIAALTSTRYAADHWSRLDEAVVRHRDQQKQHERARTILASSATVKLGSGERAELWMRSKNPKLGMRTPNDVCVEKGGYDRCLAVLK